MSVLILILALAWQERLLTPQQTEGRRLYNATCVYCHNPRAYGTEALARRLGEGKGVLEQRNDLPDDYIRGVIKQGLGNMPAYTPTDLTEGEITAIVDYLRRNSTDQ